LCKNGAVALSNHPAFMMDYICQPNLKPQTILSSQYKESAKIPQQ
jgi:hypothetical protein